MTVVFCDLCGSTALGDTADPEALRATMRDYYEQMRAILERHGGTVEKFVGDAVMAVFGVPVAHEDDALRGVRAAWEMRSAVSALGLAARVGVNTGEVVAGEGDTFVTGDAVNVAARLEQSAEAGEVLLGAETRRLVRDAVGVEPVEVAAKGKPEPLGAFRLVQVDPEAAPVARRFDTPLVGRRSELDQLAGAFNRTVREGRCHLFTVLGVAGVGKSRLVMEFLSGLDATVLHGRCLNYGEGITFWPVVSVLKQLGERARDTLARLVEGASTPNELFWAVRAQLEEVALERPMVVCFDDVHWGEATFLDLVDHIADLSRGAPLLVLCLARPELLDKRPGWGGGKLNATTILLEPLTAEECDELLAAHGDVGPEMRDRILAAAQGNPLFVEEMVALAREDRGVRVPATVQALLQARLDQLDGEERTVIDHGAVEGEVFHRNAVVELTRSPDLETQLVGLMRKELIHPARATFADDRAFRFRHLLIRDAAYDSLPKETRAELHERFAAWLERHGRELVELDEVLGYHLEQASRYRRELGRPSPEVEQRGRAEARLAERLESIDHPAVAVDRFVQPGGGVQDVRCPPASEDAHQPEPEVLGDGFCLSDLLDRVVEASRFGGEVRLDEQRAVPGRRALRSADVCEAVADLARRERPVLEGSDHHQQSLVEQSGSTGTARVLDRLVERRDGRYREALQPAREGQEVVGMRCAEIVAGRGEHRQRLGHSLLGLAQHVLGVGQQPEHQPGDAPVHPQGVVGACLELFDRAQPRVGVPGRLEHRELIEKRLRATPVPLGQQREGAAEEIQRAGSVTADGGA